jgi:hypothetical protein
MSNCTDKQFAHKLCAVGTMNNARIIMKSHQVTENDTKCNWSRMSTCYISYYRRSGWNAMRKSLLKQQQQQQQFIQRGGRASPSQPVLWGGGGYTDRGLLHSRLREGVDALESFWSLCKCFTAHPILPPNPPLHACLETEFRLRKSKQAD